MWGYGSQQSQKVSIILALLVTALEPKGSVAFMMCQILIAEAMYDVARIYHGLP